MSARLYFGAVMHSRLRPRRNRFRYDVFFLSVDVERLEASRCPLFSIDSWNLISLYRRDFGPRDGTDLGDWIRSLLRGEGLHEADGEIRLQAFPRVLGYVFNPIAFWHCYDRDGALRAVLCEVSNTFGEHHHYLLAHPDRRAIATHDWLEARKVFHVSPFLRAEGSYRFRFGGAGERADVRIDYRDAAGTVLVTTLRGDSRPLETRGLVLAIARHFWMTLAVTLRIHYQALRLWQKGVPYHPKPLPPLNQITR